MTDTQENHPKAILIPPVENKPVFFSNAETPPITPDNTGALQNSTRFQPGMSGNPKGRPKGAKSKLTDLFLDTVIQDFNAHGANTLARLREQDPTMYIKFIAVMVPKSLIQQYEQQADTAYYASLTQEEVVEHLEDARRAGIIKQAIKRERGQYS